MRSFSLQGVAPQRFRGQIPREPTVQGHQGSYETQCCLRKELSCLLWPMPNLIWVHSPSPLHIWPSGTTGLTEVEFLQCNMKFTKLGEHSDLVPPYHMTPDQLPTSLSALCLSLACCCVRERVCGYIGQGTPGELCGEIPEAPWKLLIESPTLRPRRLTADRSSAQVTNSVLIMEAAAAFIAHRVQPPACTC